ncbi:MAG: hypothetical protein ACKVQQ_15750 [Burkholderiales bacterium]
MTVRVLLACVFCSLCALARAEAVAVCYDYGCSRKAAATFSAHDLAELAALLQRGEDAAGERALIGRAIGRMYAIVATQTPIWRDRGRNSLDERNLEGAMDCIDHATNSTAFLAILERAGMLRFHRVGEPALRFAFLFLGEHWSATIGERDSADRFAVDGWFFDPGTPAAVVPLAAWTAGFDPAAASTAAQ